MKQKILILFLFFNSFFLLNCTKEQEVINGYSIFSSYEKEFMKNYKLDEQDVIPYKKYKNFNINYFFAYEKVRRDKNTYLQAINLVNYPNFYYPYTYPKKALLEDTTLILVNKSFQVSNSYYPKDLVLVSSYENIQYIKRENEIMYASSIALNNYYQMFKKAKEENINLIIYSAYRTYQKQYDLYYTVYNKDDNYSAKPGFSEHHTGLALDISDSVHGLTNNLASSNTYKWLINNSYKFGFILRYPKDKENITMYNYEPWHFRYVGTDAALIIYENNLTLEEYLLLNVEL